MAYTKQIARDCSQGACTRPAVVEVFNNRNASVGVYCASHGRLKASSLSIQEAKDAKEGK